eukprot:6171986-Pleurochrysis_carterae.AAC.1
MEQISTHHAHSHAACLVCCHLVSCMAQAQFMSPPSLHTAYSFGARPDCVMHNATPTGHHKLMKHRVVSPIPTGQAPVPAAGAFFAFANTEPRLLSDILGHPPDYVGAQYRDALRWGHTVTPLIVEVFGGFASHAQLRL